MSEQNTTTVAALSHNQKARAAWHPDFKRDAGEKAPQDEIGKGPLLVHPESAELKMQMDLLKMQRGELRGHKYPGLRITKDNLDAVIEFWGGETVAGMLDTAFNNANQRFALGTDSYAALMGEELTFALVNRRAKSESKGVVMADVKDLIQQLTDAMGKGDFAKATEIQKLLADKASLLK